MPRFCWGPMSLHLLIEATLSDVIMSSTFSTRGYQSGAEITRRDMLSRMGSGCGLVGLAAVLADEVVASRRAVSAADTAPAVPQAGPPLSPKAPHYGPKARRVIHLFMNGGPSQVDTFDPKPALEK